MVSWFEGKLLVGEYINAAGGLFQPTILYLKLIQASGLINTKATIFLPQ